MLQPYLPDLQAAQLLQRPGVLSAQMCGRSPDLEGSSCAPLHAGCVSLELITGRGVHSHWRIPVILPAVVQELNKRHLKYVPVAKGGSLLVEFHHAANRGTGNIVSDRAW